MTMNMVAQRPRGPFMVAGLLVTAAAHLGVLGALYMSHHQGSEKPPLLAGNFVNAQLVRFGKPRDLSFLPHKHGRVITKGPAQTIKVAKDLHALPHLDKEEKPPDQTDPLKKTHAEMFKDLNQDDPVVPDDDNNVGSLTGSRAGTASEASGDPYIQQLMDVIGTSWQVPTTIRASQLAKLSADVCLTITSSGAFIHYEIVRKSGNSQFDSSLSATLAMLKHLPAPPDRVVQGGHDNLRTAAAHGQLCPTFIHQ